MKRSIFLVILILAGIPAMAQSLDKETKKEVKQFLKDPQAYRNMIRDYEDQIEGLQVENNELKEANSKCEYEREAYADSLAMLKAQIETLEMEVAEAKATAAKAEELGPLPSIPDSGTHYKVQIGEFEYFDISDYFATLKVVSADVVGESMHRYHIGTWDDPKTANQFAEDMRKLGITDAFVTKFVDGKRVDFNYVEWLQSK